MLFLSKNTSCCDVGLFCIGWYLCNVKCVIYEITSSNILIEEEEENY